MMLKLYIFKIFWWPIRKLGGWVQTPPKKRDKVGMDAVPKKPEWVKSSSQK